MAIDVERIECMKITNGEMCKVPDEAILQEIVDENSLSITTTRAPNGERLVLSHPDGSWAGTAVKYKVNDGFLLFRE